MAVQTMVFKSSRILGGSITRVLMPDKLEIRNGKVRIIRRKLLGLKVNEEEIRLDRIASVRVRRGLILGRVIIETSSGTMEDIHFPRIWKWQAKKIAKAVRETL